MENIQDTRIIEAIKNFELPRYEDIPDVGFYLEQVVKYIAEFLSPFESITLTGSMISNYVKKKLIANPVKKQYSREQIAYLIFIAVAKSVLSMEDLDLFFRLQKQTYSSKRAYDYFRLEFTNVLQYVFGIKENLDNVSSVNTKEKEMLRNTIITVAHKIYLDMYFAELKEQNAGDNIGE